jgi:myb proto-oncogene protein
MRTRNSRQCQERWENYLNHSINTNQWTSEEDNLLIQQFKEFDSKWTIISNFFIIERKEKSKIGWVH